MSNYLYDYSPSMIKSRPVVFVIVLISCMAVVGIPILIVWWLRCINSRLIITENQIIFRQGILSRKERRLNKNKVTTFDIQQDVWDRALGACKVSIYAAGDKAEFYMAGLPHPEKLRSLI